MVFGKCPKNSFKTLLIKNVQAPALEFDKYHKIAVHDHVRGPKLWCT